MLEVVPDSWPDKYLVWTLDDKELDLPDYEEVAAKQCNRIFSAVTQFEEPLEQGRGLSEGGDAYGQFALLDLKSYKQRDLE